MRFHKTGAVLLAALGLAGCAGQRELAPPGMPSIAAIAAQQASLATVADVPDFYKTGLFLAQKGCGGYFDQAVMAALRAARTSGESALLSGLATGLMGLAGAGGPATAALGLATSFGQQWQANSMDTSLAGSDPAATATLVAAAQGALIAAEQNPQTAADAYAAIYAVTRACSPSGIRALEEQAIAAAPDHLVVSGGTAPSSTPNMRPYAVAPLSSPASLPTVRVR